MIDIKPNNVVFSGSNSSTFYKNVTIVLIIPSLLFLFSYVKLTVTQSLQFKIRRFGLEKYSEPLC